jgi:DNA-binding phage protein
MDIKQILSEATDGALNEEVLSEIENVFEQKVNEKVSIHVEQALNEQDELYTEKLKELVEKIDTDHTAKLERVVEAIDKDRTEKLKMVIEKYESELNEDAEKFQTSLVESISDYIDVYLEEKIPVESVQEAVKNTKARKILESLRNHLAVDSALEKESIKEAVIDGHNQINEASKKLESVANENTVLKEELDTVKSNLLIEQKTAGLDKRAKSYMRKVLKDKGSEYIAENFDYTLKLFNKKEKDRLETLKEEALSTRDNVDRVVYEDTNTQEVVSESADSPYLDELSKY